MNHSKIIAEFEINFTTLPKPTKKRLKSFITSTRLSAYAEGKKDALGKVLERTEKLKQKYSDADTLQTECITDGYNAAVSDTREIIKKLIEE